MREIGSEFYDISVSKRDNGIFPDDVKWFLSGRSALSYIIEDAKQKYGLDTVALPSWCCDSIIVPFLNAGITVNFYPVYVNEKRLVQDISGVENCDAVFVMDYFGYVGDTIDYSGFTGFIIRDLTHSIFSKIYDDADYYFGSLRKWTGIWTGGFAWARKAWDPSIKTKEADSQYIALRKKAMEDKASYLRSYTGEKTYLSLFSMAESYLEDEMGIQGAAKRDIFYIRKLDIDTIKQRRRDNAGELMKLLGDYLIFPQLKKGECPLFVPIQIPKYQRNGLCQYLIDHKIYCPIHWPISSFHKLTFQTRQIYETELSIICDQRYVPRDMEYIGQRIRTYMEGQ